MWWCNQHYIRLLAFQYWESEGINTKTIISRLHDIKQSQKRCFQFISSARIKYLYRLHRLFIPIQYVTSAPGSLDLCTKEQWYADRTIGIKDDWTIETENTQSDMLIANSDCLSMSNIVLKNMYHNILTIINTITFGDCINHIWQLLSLNEVNYCQKS